jgi:AhpD family alkylhydroperoxidase
VRPPRRILAAAIGGAPPRTLARLNRPQETAVGKLEQDFAAYRARMNERVLAEDNRVIKRIYSVDSLAYGEDGTLPKQTRELLGLVASLVLRCDDCVKYHLVESRAAGSSRKEIVEAMSIGLVVGGTIVIPHLRRAIEFLDDLESGAAT